MKDKVASEGAISLCNECGNEARILRIKELNGTEDSVVLYRKLELITLTVYAFHFDTRLF